jgi:hypothetical protein
VSGRRRALVAGMVLLALCGGGGRLRAQGMVTGGGFSQDVSDRAETFFRFVTLTLFGLLRWGGQASARAAGWMPPAVLDGRPEVPIPFFGWTPPAQLQRDIGARRLDESPLPPDVRQPAAQGREPAPDGSLQPAGED